LIQVYLFVHLVTQYLAFQSHRTFQVRGFQTVGNLSQVQAPDLGSRLESPGGLQLEGHTTESTRPAAYTFAQKDLLFRHQNKGLTASSSKRGPTVPSSKQPSSSHPQKNTTEDKDELKKDKKDQKGRFKKGPTPPPLIPPAVPGKRYLPGDIRYKQSYGRLGRERLAPSSSLPKDQPSSSKVFSKPESSSKRLDEHSKPVNRKPDTDRSRHMEKGRPQSAPLKGQSHMSREHHGVRPPDRKPDRSREHRDRHREREQYRSYNRAYDYDMEDDYEDDYDSEMDDFIDDSGLDMDELSRQEFEETLK
ncbi:hypothetical protein COOONC_03530, partial [Cooperia oncophora]